MLSNNVTACIFAWNEEARILRCIDNFKHTFAILVIDNCSTDRTAEVVRAAGHRCVQIGNPGFIETPSVMDPLAAACETDYLLVASVSEFVPLALQRLYAKVADTGSHDVVRAFRESITAGEPIPISGVARAGAEGSLRFFRKGGIDFRDNQLHGHGRIAVAAERVLNVVTDPALHFYQFRDYDCSKTEQVMCRYDDVLARQRFDAGARFSWPRALFHTFKSFVSSYLRCGSMRFGMIGFLHCYYRAHMEFTVWLRVWEWQHDHDLAGVKLRNDDVRRRMEAEFAEVSSAAPQVVHERPASPTAAAPTKSPMDI
jgi:hypothetical protein